MKPQLEKLYPKDVADNEAERIKEITGENAEPQDYKTADALIEEEKAHQVASVKTLDELCELLKSFGNIQGSHPYSPEYMIYRIEQVRHGHRDLGFLTSAYGIQEKVKSLLDTDPKYRKYVLKNKND